jgi:hypothetical protein
VVTVRVPVRPTLSPAARREVREFARLVDRPIGDRPGGPAPAGGAPVDRVPAPSAAPGASVPDAADLAGLAVLARSLPPLTRGPDPAFRTALRERILAEGITLPRQVGPGTIRRPAVREGSVRQIRIPLGLTGPRRRLVRPLGAVAVALAALIALVPLSSSALPGDPLYGFKRTVEGLQLTMATTDAARGTALLADAATRLGEAEALVARSGGGNQLPVHDLDVALSGLQSQAGEGSRWMLAAFRSDRRPVELARVSDFLSDAVGRTRALAPRVPVAEAARMNAVEATLTGIHDQLSGALTACGPSCAGIALPSTPAAGTGTGAGTGGLPGQPAAGSGTGVPPRGGSAGVVGTSGVVGAVGSAASGASSAAGGGSTGPPVVVSAGGGGVGVTASAVPSAPATVSVGTSGASVGASLPGGGGATVSVGPTPTLSVCIPVPLIKTC